MAAPNAAAPNSAQKYVRAGDGSQAGRRSRRRLPSQIIDVEARDRQLERQRTASQNRSWALWVAGGSAVAAAAMALVAGGMDPIAWILTGVAASFSAVWPLTRVEVPKAVAIGALWDAAVTHEPTGLPNRRVFEVELERALTRCKRREELVGVAIVDVDGMHDINAECGKSVGDVVVIEVGQRLDAQTRLSDVVAHFDNDAFAVIFEPLMDRDAANAAGSRLRNALRLEVPQHGDMRRTTVSIGIVVSPADVRVGDALAAAGQAVTTAKAMGGDMVHVVTSMDS